MELNGGNIWSTINMIQKLNISKTCSVSFVGENSAKLLQNFVSFKTLFPLRKLNKP